MDIHVTTKRIEMARPVKLDERRMSHASHNALVPGILLKLHGLVIASFQDGCIQGGTITSSSPMFRKRKLQYLFVLL